MGIKRTYYGQSNLIDGGDLSLVAIVKLARFSMVPSVLHCGLLLKTPLAQLVFAKFMPFFKTLFKFNNGAS